MVDRSPPTVGADSDRPVPADLFHPSVARWFLSRFQHATEVQARAWRLAAQRRDLLVVAPTGSGKTLAAFLAALSGLVEEGIEGGLADEVHVLYVSPLKALSNDIERNLREPLKGVREELSRDAHPDIDIRIAVRTGDTTSRERAMMRRHAPHILVTTPESLFILLTSDSGRNMLRSTRSVILDELHAVAGTKRGAHFMLSLERLDALCGAPPVRIGLSATVKSVEAMARYLTGGRDTPAAVVNAGHVRDRDLALELPRSPLSAVMANEVWNEIYDRLADLARQHRTTLIFVNQRRVAERTARHLAQRLGDEHVTAHHGSLAREHRLKAEQRLKSGDLKVLVATSSLELGIDIGDIDLVCQLGSPRAISALLQRVGRSGHSVGAVPKGRLFPLSLDDLVECTALLDAIRRGELEIISVPAAPLDVLAQQIVAEASCREWRLDALHSAFCRAAPYRDLPLARFEAVVQMLADGFTTRRGRRGAYLHYDAVNRTLRGRRGARLAAVTNAGVIPDQFDYEVVLLPEEHRVGTLHEDFAFESSPGDIFQLGNTSYRIVKVETAKVLVEDAKGQPPNMPFWLGEGLSRSDELSAAVSRLNSSIERILQERPAECRTWLESQLGAAPPAAQQLADYLEAAYATLGALPNADTVLMERFFDEVGDMHLVIHSPLGARINRAWGLALRKRFCRKFNFELQASALDDSIVLSLGASHSFPLEDVTSYLRADSARDVLIQALLDAPMFKTRWRWNVTAALAVKRVRNGKRVPPQFQRADSEDLLTLVFPEQLACAENLVGDREIPDHPLVFQTIEDCLHETMDAAGLERLLGRLERGALRVVCRDTPEPSPLAHAVLNARPYAFLDDGDAEGRRTRSVRTQATPDLAASVAGGVLSAEAIGRVLEEAAPQFSTADELHDALLVFGFLTEPEVTGGAAETSDITVHAMLRSLITQNRVAPIRLPRGTVIYGAAERLHELDALIPAKCRSPDVRPTRSDRPDADQALLEIIRSRLELAGPVTCEALADPIAANPSAVRVALLALESQGTVIRGAFTRPDVEEWCERRLLARIYRYARDARRAAVRPVSPAQYVRFLFEWHRMAGDEGRRSGEDGLLSALEQLEGCVAPAVAWERDLLPARVEQYHPAMLDRLCASGRVVWHRPVQPAPSDSSHRSGPVRATPILICPRAAIGCWQAEETTGRATLVSARAQRILDALREHGALFATDLLPVTQVMRSELDLALGELVSSGLVHCDSFAGIRALTTPARRSRRHPRPRAESATRLDQAGRWALTRPVHATPQRPGLADPRTEHIARTLLTRYGVVFRKVLEREDGLPAWRDLFYVYRRLEARGEILGGRFVSGFSGEQFALPQAAKLLRQVETSKRVDRIALSAADPLNLVGVLTTESRIPRLADNRVLFENGVPVAARAAGETRHLVQADHHVEWERHTLLIRQARLPGRTPRQPRMGRNNAA